MKGIFSDGCPGLAEWGGVGPGRGKGSLSPLVSLSLYLSFPFHPLHLCLPASLPLDVWCAPSSVSVTPSPVPRKGTPSALSRGLGLPLRLPLPSLSCLSVCPPLTVCLAGLQRPSCGYVVCTVLLSLAVLLAVAVTGTVLFLNHAHAPSTAPPPIVSTGPAGANGALVTVERADSSRLSILIDPRCPDLTDGFTRLEDMQASVLQALAAHQAQPRLAGEQDRELLDTLADQLPRLLARASELQDECAGLRKGHGTLGQGLGALRSEQAHLVQVRAGPGPEVSAGGRGCCPLASALRWALDIHGLTESPNAPDQGLLLFLRTGR